MSIAEKLTAIAENVQKVYDAGKAAGGEGDAENNPFYYATRLDNTMGGATFPENYEAVVKIRKAPKVCNYLFNNCANLKSVKMISEDQTNGVELAYSFRAGSVTPTLELVDFSQFNKMITSLQETFRNQTKLKSILGIFDLSECTNVNYAFSYCTALEDIEFVSGTIKISILFAQSPLLTDKSIQSIIDGLADLTGQTAQTLTVHATVGAALTDEQKAAASAKNWTLVY